MIRKRDIIRHLNKLPQIADYDVYDTESYSGERTMHFIRYTVYERDRAGALTLNTTTYTVCAKTWAYAMIYLPKE